MALLGWLDTREVDQFAREIAAELVKRVAPASLESADEKAARRLRATHNAVFSRAEQFARNHKLNLYTRARLGNQFRWALKDAGYPLGFVETWTHELVALVTLKR